MSVIYKYQMQIAAIQYVMMPKGAEILKVEFQNEILCAWALVEEEITKVEHYFAIFGTGHDMPLQRAKYLNTVFQNNSLVWHVFDIGEQ